MKFLEKGPIFMIHKTMIFKALFMEIQITFWNFHAQNSRFYFYFYPLCKSLFRFFRVMKERERVLLSNIEFCIFDDARGKSWRTIKENGYEILVGLKGPFLPPLKLPFWLHCRVGPWKKIGRFLAWIKISQASRVRIPLKGIFFKTFFGS